VLEDLQTWNLLWADTGSAALDRKTRHA
jgi:hypothetical protein